MKKIPRQLISSGLALLLAISGVSCTQEAREARHIQRADKFFAAGDYDQAEIEYINAVRIKHTDAKAFGRLGIIAFEQGRMQQAYGRLLRACQLDTNNLDYHRELGMFYLMASRKDKAREEAAYVLSRRPDDPEAPGILGDSATTLRELDQARDFLQKLKVAPAKSAPIEVAVGNLYLREREQTAALAAFDRAKSVDPHYGLLYAALGNYYWSEKNIQKADEAFKMSADSAPARSARRLKYAQFKIQNGDVAAGRRILEDTLAKAPDYLPGILLLAGIDVSEKKYDDANDWLSKALARDPENYEALMLSGRLGLASGDSQKAVAQFEKMHEAFPKSPAVLYQLGLAYNAAGDTPKAMSILNLAIAQNPRFAEAILALAQMDVSKGDFSSAVILLRQVIAQHPQMPEAQLLLANTYEQQGNWDDAMAIYRQLEQQFPNNAQTPMLLGMVLGRQHKLQEAREQFTHALELNPGYLAALEQLTSLDIGEGHYSVAMDRVQRLIAKDPKAPEPSLLVSDIYLAQNKVTESIAALTNAIGEHPDFIQGSFTLAKIYNATGQPNKALETLRALVAKHPDQAGSWMLLGAIESNLKDYKAAMEAYEKVLALDSKNSAALNNLAFLYSEDKELDKGYELAQRARELLPHDPSTADTLGWILYEKGEYPQASGLLHESSSQIPSQPSIQLHLGMTLYMLGDEDGARAALQKAVASKAEMPEKGEAEKRLKVLAVNAQTAGPEARAMLEKRVAEMPADPIALSRLGAIYKRDGNADKAIATYEAALQANPKNPRVLVSLAQLYSAQSGQLEKALDLAKQAYKLSPSEPGAARTLGHLALLHGDYKFALGVLQEAAQRQSGDAELLYDLARANYTQGQVADTQADLRSALQGGANFSHAAEAKRLQDMIALAANPSAAGAANQVEQSLKAEPDNVPALMAHGALNEQKGDVSPAVHDYEEALNHYPDFAPAKRRLAILYSQAAGDLNKNAYQVAIKAYEAYPDDADMSESLGIIMYRQGEYGRSAERLQESLGKKHNDAQLLYYLGMDQYQLKRRAESKKNLTSALALKLPDKLAGEAKRVLIELK